MKKEWVSRGCNKKGEMGVHLAYKNLPVVISH